MVGRDAIAGAFAQGAAEGLDMPAYKWSTIAANQSVTFAPGTDTFAFDDPSIRAALVALAWTDATRVQLSFGGKSIWLLADVRNLTQINVTFANGSKLLIGDNSTRASDDDGDNTLFGTAKADHIYGLGGDDTIYGEGGDDILDGGEGNDWLSTRDGAATLLGGAGDDNLTAFGLGSKLLDGGDGNDTLIGGEGLLCDASGANQDLFLQLSDSLAAL